MIAEKAVNESKYVSNSISSTSSLINISESTDVNENNNMIKLKNNKNNFSF